MSCKTRRRVLVFSREFVRMILPRICGSEKPSDALQWHLERGEFSLESCRESSLDPRPLRAFLAPI